MGSISRWPSDLLLPVTFAAHNRRTDMRARYLAALSFAAIVMIDCGPHESEAQRHHDANTPAGKAGQAAHRAAVEADRAAAAVGRKLDKVAHDAREGWNEDARKHDTH